jgi:L-ascorbate metabolism protein UlaG (beta-lactamase superfamily)
LKATVKITYLDNSGFAVETENRFLVFDYYNPKPKGGRLSQGVVNPEDIGDRRAVLFVSHSHYDHYHKGIFQLRDQVPHIGYILSDDVKCKPGADVLLVAPDGDYPFDGMEIHTLRSTDLGVAFLLKADGMTIYHGGDLNWWHWIGEPEEKNQSMARRFLAEMDSLRGMDIDVAFVPMDPRQEHNYLLGLNAFMERANARHVIPMHFGRAIEAFDWLEQDPRADGYRERIVPLTRRGQQVTVTI